MTIDYDTSILDNFQEPIPVDLKALGIDVCGDFNAAFERYNAKRPDGRKLDYGRFLTTILVKQLPAFIKQEEKAERGGGGKRKYARSGSDQGGGQKVHRPFGNAPQAAE